MSFERFWLITAGDFSGPILALFTVSSTTVPTHKQPDVPHKLKRRRRGWRAGATRSSRGDATDSISPQQDGWANAADPESEGLSWVQNYGAHWNVANGTDPGHGRQPGWLSTGQQRAVRGKEEGWLCLVMSDGVTLGTSVALFTQRLRIISRAEVRQFSADDDSHRAKNLRRSTV